MPTYTTDCQHCGKQFTRRVSNLNVIPKYCCQKCSARGRPPQQGKPRVSRVISKCLECGKEMHVLPDRIADGRGKFCSRSCSAKYRFARLERKPRSAEHRRKLGLAHIGKVPPNKLEPIHLACEICGKSFDVQPSRKDKARYCSRACQHESKRRVTGTQHPLWTKVQRACEWCGKVVWVKPAKLAEFRFCSRRCQGTWTSAQMAAKHGPTSIERLLMDELDRRGVAYKPQHKIAHWLVDIALPQYRIAVEADGNYWHSSDKQKVKDANKDHWLKAHKWAMLRFTETEIHQSPSACIDLVLKTALAGPA